MRDTGAKVASRASMALKAFGEILGAEGIRRKAFMPRYMIRTVPQLTLQPSPLCLLPLLCHQWPI